MSFPSEEVINYADNYKNKLSRRSKKHGPVINERKRNKTLMRRKLQSKKRLASLCKKSDVLAKIQDNRLRVGVGNSFYEEEEEELYSSYYCDCDDYSCDEDGLWLDHYCGRYKNYDYHDNYYDGPGDCVCS